MDADQSRKSLNIAKSSSDANASTPSMSNWDRFCGALSPCIPKVFKDRYEQSNLKKWVTEPPMHDECDNVVNASGIIAALLLTIPYSAATVFGTSFFESLQTLLPPCNLKGTFLGDNPEEVRTSALSLLSIITLSSVYALMGCLMYYIFRPSEDRPSKNEKTNEKVAGGATEPPEEKDKSKHPAFQDWWDRGGRYFLLLLIMCICLATFAIWFLMLILLLTYVVTADDFCDDYKNPTFLYVQCTLFWIFTFLGFYFIF